MNSQGIPSLKVNHCQTYVIVAQRLWQAISGVITVLLVSINLSAAQQGWYYTFLGVAALYVLFEMGLSSAVLQAAAHGFAKLSWVGRGGIEGDGSSLFKLFFVQSVKMYLSLAIIFFILVGCVGLYLFGHRNSAEEFNWISPWIGLVFMTSLNMTTLPFLAVREGSGRIVEVYLLKITQGIMGSSACWLVLMTQSEFLWASVMTPLMSFFVFIVWVNIRTPGMLDILREHLSCGWFSWTKSIWFVNWRIGMGFVSVFMWSQLCVPILFYFQGPVVAGQMGLSMTIAHTIGLVAQSWIAATIPELSRAAIMGNWNRWKALFDKKLLFSSIVFIVLSGCALMAVMSLKETPIFATRFLPIGGFGLLLAFVFFNLLNAAFAVQLRTLNREPMAFLFLLGAVITVCGSLWAAQHGGSQEVIFVMLATQIFCVFPWSFGIWHIYRKSVSSEIFA